MLLWKTGQVHLWQKMADITERSLASHWLCEGIPIGRKVKMFHPSKTRARPKKKNNRIFATSKHGELVGGWSNPFEKYAQVQIGPFPQLGVKINLKPPPIDNVNVMSRMRVNSRFEQLGTRICLHSSVTVQILTQRKLQSNNFGQCTSKKYSISRKII